MVVALDEYGRPFIIIKEQELKARLRGALDAHKPNIPSAKAVAKILPRPHWRGQYVQSPDGDVNITNDGATILEQMDVDNQIPKLMVELSRSQDCEISDGTTGGAVMASSLLDQTEKLLEHGVHPIRIVEGYRIAVEHLERIAHKFEFGLNNLEPLVQTCMTTCHPRMCRRSLAEIAVKAFMAVADLERKDMNLDLI